MSGEVHRQRCVLYGPNEEIISETNPLPVQLEGESKVIITGEPTVKINAADASKTVNLQAGGHTAGITAAGFLQVLVESGKIEVTNKILVANVEAGKIEVINKIVVATIEAGKLEVTNKIVVGTLEGEPKIKPEGQTATGSALVGKPIPIAGVDGGGLVRTLLTSATGILQVEGIAGATAAIEGKTAVGTEPTDKPLDTGVEDVGKKLRRTKGDEVGTQYVAPFNLEKPWSFNKTVSATETFEIPAVAGYRYIITQIYSQSLNVLLLTTLSSSTVKVFDNEASKLLYFASPSALTAGITASLVGISGNPIYIALAISTKLKVEMTVPANVQLTCSMSGYMIKG